MSGKRGPRLATLGDVSVFLGKVIREAYRGELDAATAAKLGYLCNILKGCLESSDLEARIERLELVPGQRDRL